MHHISPSQVVLEDTCPRKYCLRYLWGLRTPQGKGAAIGDAIHHAVSCPDDPVEPVVMDNQVIASTEKISAVAAQAIPHFPREVGSTRSEVERPFAVGLTEDTQLLGRYDWIWRIPGVAVVHDLKTTSSLGSDRVPTPEQLDADLQWRGYAIAALLEYPETKLVQGKQVYVKTSKDRATGQYPLAVEVAVSATRDRIEREYLPDYRERARRINSCHQTRPNILSVSNNLGAACSQYGGCPYLRICYGNIEEAAEIMAKLNLDPERAQLLIDQIIAAGGSPPQDLLDCVPPSVGDEIPPEIRAFMVSSGALPPQTVDEPVEPPAPVDEPVEKKKRGRPRKTAATSDAPSGSAPAPLTTTTSSAPVSVTVSAELPTSQRYLYVGCRPDHECDLLVTTAAYRAAETEATRVAKAPHWLLAEFGKGPGLLVEAFRARVDELPPHVVVDLRLRGCQAVAEILYDWADVVISASF